MNFVKGKGGEQLEIVGKELIALVTTGIGLSLVLSAFAQNFNASATILSPPTCGLFHNDTIRSVASSASANPVNATSLGPISNLNFGQAFPGNLFLRVYEIAFNTTGNVAQNITVQATNWTNGVNSYGSNFTKTLVTFIGGTPISGLQNQYDAGVSLSTTPIILPTLSGGPSGIFPPNFAVTTPQIATKAPSSQPPSNYTQQIFFTSIC